MLVVLLQSCLGGNGEPYPGGPRDALAEGALIACEDAEQRYLVSVFQENDDAYAIRARDRLLDRSDSYQPLLRTEDPETETFSDEQISLKVNISAEDDGTFAGEVELLDAGDDDLLPAEPLDLFCRR